MTVNVFSKKVLIEVTIFMSPTWRRDHHFTWFLSHVKVYPSARRVKGSTFISPLF